MEIASPCFEINGFKRNRFCISFTFEKCFNHAFPILLNNYESLNNDWVFGEKFESHFFNFVQRSRGKSFGKFENLTNAFESTLTKLWQRNYRTLESWKILILHEMNLPQIWDTIKDRGKIKALYILTWAHGASSNEE